MGFSEFAIRLNFQYLFAAQMARKSIRNSRPNQGEIHPIRFCVHTQNSSTNAKPIQFNDFFFGIIPPNFLFLLSGSLLEVGMWASECIWEYRENDIIVAVARNFFRNDAIIIYIVIYEDICARCGKRQATHSSRSPCFACTVLLCDCSIGENMFMTGCRHIHWFIFHK